MSHDKVAHLVLLAIDLDSVLVNDVPSALYAFTACGGQVLLVHATQPL